MLNYILVLKMTLFLGKKNYGKVFAPIMVLKKLAKKVILDNTS